MSTWLGLILLVVSGAIIAFRSTLPPLGVTPETAAAITGSLALLLFILGPLIGRKRDQIVATVRTLFVWSIIGAGLVAGYLYRADIMRGLDKARKDIVAPEVGVAITAPEPGAEQPNAAVRIRRQPSGQFIARAQINDINLLMLIDTGASTVVLRTSDAEKIGVNTDALDYSVPVQTANGTSFAARVTLSSVWIGPVGIGQVQALVAKPGALHRSLLGMSFLSRLRSYEFSGDFLTLRS